MNKSTILKLAQLIIVLGAFIDTNLELLSMLGFTNTTIGWIKLLGLITAALLPSLTSKYNFNDPKFPKENSVK